jgi:hypothetical protein
MILMLSRKRSIVLIDVEYAVRIIEVGHFRQAERSDRSTPPGLNPRQGRNPCPRLKPILRPSPHSNNLSVADIVDELGQVKAEEPSGFRVACQESDADESQATS